MSTIKFTEDSYEQALIELFKRLGYEYECGYNIERDYRIPYHKEMLDEAIRKINPGVPEEALQDAVRRLTHIEEASLALMNDRFTEMMQCGVAATAHEGGEERHYLVKVTDYEQPLKNRFFVANQWRVEDKKPIRCDMVVFVNGLPVVVIELKSPSEATTGEEDAYKQIRNYQLNAPSLFVYNAFNVTSDMAITRAGTITAKAERYMEWKTKDGELLDESAIDYDTFFEGIFTRERFIDILHNFICFDKSEGKPAKIMAGYHQYFAVRKALSRTVEALAGNHKIGVFWHTQGSGKSLSMVFFTHLLLERYPESTIVVVTDRKDLDIQLYGQFARCKDFLRQTPINAGSRDHLQQLILGRKTGGIIFTTIQKFEEGEGALSDRENIIVMTDEAHRSQYGDTTYDVQQMRMRKGFAKLMREALPNASFIGFTGTPISMKDKDTVEVFGDYIDIYDMTQSVRDHATVPVYYESRAIKLKLDEKILQELDEEFETLQSLGATDEQLEATKRDLSRLEAVLGAPETVTSLAKDILYHYIGYRQQELTGKVMIVALNRRIAMQIYYTMLSLRPDWKEKVKVVMTESNKDPEEWHDVVGNDAYRKELAKRFKDEKDDFKIAIVVDMWLTGFDVPSLSTLYVYKPMSGHNLMQAIARVNRVYPEKQGGLVVDYIGIAQALKRAMKEYTTRDQKQFGDPDISKTALLACREKQEICRDFMHGYDYSDFCKADDYKKGQIIKGGVNHLLGCFAEDKQRLYLKESQLLHNSVTLCRSLLTEEERLEVAYMDSVRVLLARLLMNSGKISKKEINERISLLLEQTVHSEGIIDIFKDDTTDFSLFDPAFMEQIRKMKEQNLAIKLLENLLKGLVKDYGKTNLVQAQKFSDLLSRSLSSYLKGQLSNAEVIEELIRLAKQMQISEEEGNKLGLNKEEKAFYDALSTPEGVRQAYSDETFVALTHELTEALRKNRTIDWNKKESARAQMRVMIKRLLKKYKYPPEGADAALQSVMDQCDQWADREENFYVDSEPAVAQSAPQRKIKDPHFIAVVYGPPAPESEEE